MAFINLTRKYVFLATARCASTSCYEDLKNISIKNNENFITHANEMPDLYHMGLSEFLENYPQFKNYYIFATVRNPTSRFISSWKEFRKGGHIKWSYDMTDFNNIDEFIDNFENTDCKFSIHFTPQYFQLCSFGNRFVDKILYFESLSDDFANLTKFLYGKYYYLSSLIRSTSKQILSRKTNKKLQVFVKNYYRIDIKSFYS